jgi:nucleoside-diphosphate-sugar epimerase
MKEMLPLKSKDVDDFLAKPTSGVIETVRDLEGDIVILGIGGKMGTTLGFMLKRALQETGKKNRVIGVSRFSNAEARKVLEESGIETVACDLSDPTAVNQLAEYPNVFYLVAQKFGTSDRPEETWIQNVLVPSYVAQRYRHSRIVAFSTGCVYPFAEIGSRGCKETDAMDPVGEYASSCIGRERVFSHFSRQHETPVCFYRLNYAIDLRYGVLVDLAKKVLHNEEINLSTGHVNVIWQGDAVARAIECLAHCSTPPSIFNITGGETLKVRDLAAKFGSELGVEPKFSGSEKSACWLSDATKSIEIFGEPSVSVDEMIHWIATYLKDGGELLGKPTHFESRSGKF